MKKTIALFAGLLLISGCMSSIITPSQMQAKMQFRGFSVKRPEDSRWFVNIHEQDPRLAMFRFKTESETHSFYASATHQKIAIQPKTIEEFKAYVDEANLAMGPRNESLSYHSKATTKQGQWTIEYTSKVLDKAAANSNSPLIMKLTGYTVLHPSWDRTTIDVMYSERGTSAEVNGSLDPVGRSFISGVTIESEPGKPIK